MQEYGISVIEFNDLLLNGDLNNLEKMADLIIHKGLYNVSWHGNFVVRKMSKQLIRKLRQAGLRGATFGLESASPRLLKLMNKNVDLATACSVIKEFAKAGVVVNVNWIIGFPGEKRQDLVETAKFLFRHRKYILELSSIAILAINSPSILSKNTEQLKINMGLNALDWSLEDNDLGERIHRRDAFLRFAQGIYKLHPKSGLSSYFSARKLLKTFIRELYS